MHANILCPDIIIVARYGCILHEFSQHPSESDFNFLGDEIVFSANIIGQIYWPIEVVWHRAVWFLKPNWAFGERFPNIMNKNSKSEVIKSDVLQM